MWIIKKLSDGSRKFLISEKQSYIVGRKNCNIILEDDPSVSRKHCTLHIAKQNGCPFPVNTSTGIWVVDEQSKYGTFKKENNDWVKLNPGENTKFSQGSIIRFGLMENVWSFEFKPLIICTSGISMEQKKNLEKILQSIDGYLKNVWCKECSFVIVNEITLTVKVVLALIYGIPIVTPNYLQEAVECIKGQKELPKYENYRPEIKEILLDKSLVSLDVKIERKQLFKGKTFVIPSKKQLETLKEIIVSAGGNVELLSHKSNWDRLAENNIVIVQLPFNKTGISTELIKVVNEISKFLKDKHGVRVVPESEIAQAVAYSSTEKFCNPKSNWFTLKVGKDKEVESGTLMVEETPNILEESRNSQFGVVPSSISVGSEGLFNINDALPSPSPKPGSSTDDNVKLFKDIRREIPSDKKRAHSPSRSEGEVSSKKAKSAKISNTEEQPKQDNLKDKTPSFNSKNTDQKSSEPSKATVITDFFKKKDKQPEVNKQKKQPEVNKSEEEKQSSNDFWSLDYVNPRLLKRKTSTASTDSSESSSRKKPKVFDKFSSSSKTTSHMDFDTPREVVEIVENSSAEKSNQFPPVQRVKRIEKQIDFSDFFGKEITDAVEDLNSTIFSLTLISPAYLKKDGTLIDPPIEPVNIKKFKKQKITPLKASIENEGTALQGDWIEPHSDFYNITTVS